MDPQEVFLLSLTLWSYFKSILAKKSTFRDFMFHVTSPKNNRLMKTQKYSPIRFDGIFCESKVLFVISWPMQSPPPPTYTHTPRYAKNDRLMKIQEVFSYSLSLYLFIFILRKESTFRDSIRYNVLIHA